MRDNGLGTALWDGVFFYRLETRAFEGHPHPMKP